MNIQGLNPLSLSSASEASGASGLLAGGSAALFSSALLEQLTQLQSSLQNGGMADLQQLGGLSGEIDSQHMRGFAALFGKNLPTASKLDQDINLDDTLQALADVLQYLQSLEPPATVQHSDLPVTSANQQELTDADTENAELTKLQTENAAALGLIQTQARLEADDDHLGDAMTTAIASGEAAPVVKSGAPLPAAEFKQDPLAILKGEEKAPTGLSVDAGFAKALSEQDGAFNEAGQDSGANSFLGKQELAVAKNQTGNAEADGGLSRMTADIAQLNKSVNSTGHGAAPAIAKPLTHPEWNTELGEKLLWMHKQAIPSAEIRLNPEHLGPISIKIDVNQDQASVSFTAQHGAVRDAIETAIPKLREMLGGQNLNLADVNVSQQQSEQKQGREFFHMAGEQNRNGQSEDPAEAPVNEGSTNILDEIEAGRAIASSGLLSLFA